MKKKDFRVNEYITLKLGKSGETSIYVNEEKFIQCKCLLLEIPFKDAVDSNGLESIDEFSERFGNPLSIHSSQFPKVPSSTYFWGHCSNLQTWAENNYSTNLLHSTIAFPLLKRLTEVGDIKARRMFKDEIVERIKSGYIPTIVYLVMSHYLDYLTEEEFQVLIEDIKENKCILDEKNLDLIWSFQVGREALTVNSIFFLIEHPKIMLFELLIKYGNFFFYKDGDQIGPFRQWISRILDKLWKYKFEFLQNKIRRLVEGGIIQVREYEYLDEKLGFYRKKIDYSIMDEFSILLYNRLR